MEKEYLYQSLKKLSKKGEIDFAVHSAKDLPMELAEGLEIVGVPKRADIGM